MCASVTKRLTTPAFQRGRKAQNGPSSEADHPDSQFEGLQIQRIANNKLYHRLGTSAERKSKVGRKSSAPRRPRGPTFHSQTRQNRVIVNQNANANGLPSPPKLGPIRWVQTKPQQKQQFQGSLQTAEFEGQLLLQYQRTLFPYKKLLYNPAVAATHNPRTGAHFGLGPELPTMTEDPAALPGFAYAKVKTGRKARPPQSPKKTDTILPAPVAKPGLISVGHNIMHVWNYKLVGFESNDDQWRRQRNPFARYQHQENHIAVHRAEDSQQDGIKRTHREPQLDLRVFQTLLKSWNMPQLCVAPSLGNVLSQDSGALTISKKPQFLKSSVCRSGSISACVSRTK